MLTTVLQDLYIFFGIMMLFLMAFGTTKSIMENDQTQFLDRMAGAVSFEWKLMFGEFGGDDDNEGDKNDKIIR